MPRALHIVQGLSAAGSFIQAMHPAPGELLAREDVLSCGPLPPFQSFEQWTTARQAFWDSVLPRADRWPLKSDIAANPSALSEAESITLWLGTGVAEQLLLAWLIQVLKALRSKAELRLAQFLQVGEQKMEVLGLGMLNPERIKCHPPIQAVSSAATRC